MDSSMVTEVVVNLLFFGICFGSILSQNVSVVNFISLLCDVKFLLSWCGILKSLKDADKRAQWALLSEKLFARSKRDGFFDLTRLIRNNQRFQVVDRVLKSFPDVRVINIQSTI